ncbi:MAG: MFS transporter [Bifidobacteriaceae bacterium]|jgi:MFS family permease|nr:MFS transporter [Bifidobacteriaceae bacterium]
MRRSFLAYQGSSLLSDLGNSLTAVVLPLLVLQTTGSVLSAGWLALATGLPQFVAAAAGGVALDRLNRRSVAVVGDLASAASIGGLALVHATSGLNLTWFIVFGCLSAVGDMPAMTAREAMAPRLAEHSGVAIERVVAVRSGLSSAAIMVGPAVACLMIGWGIQNAALWTTAGLSALAALLGWTLPRTVGRVGADGASGSGTSQGGAVSPTSPSIATGGQPADLHPWRELADGVRHLFKDQPLVRLVSLTSLVMACAVAITQGLALPYLLLEAGKPGRVGVTLALMAVGVAIGAAVYGTAARRWRARGFGLLGGALFVAGVWLLAVLPDFGWLLGAMTAMGAGAGLLGSVFATVSVVSPDPALRGRVLGNQAALMLGFAPLATLMAAFGINQLGLPETLGSLAVIVTVTMVLTVTARSWRLAPPPSGTSPGEATLDEVKSDEAAPERAVPDGAALDGPGRSGRRRLDPAERTESD